MLCSCGHRPGFSGPGEAGKLPRGRPSCYATATIGTTFADPYRLGTHSYSGGKSEKSGILYTCRGGHIDLAHLRKGADWTKFFAERTLEQLKRNMTKFSFKFYEPSRYFVEVTYPENWHAISEEQRQETARDIAIRLGQYFAFTGCTWHEILTWFGYRSFALYPEFPSSFSWEDTYSNLLGTHLAVKALRDTDRDYDEAMTLALSDELRDLGVQPKKTAIFASEKMRGQWYSGEILFLIKVQGRNLDMGLDDGYVTPWLVPSLGECPDAKPSDCPVPNPDFLADYGFSVRLQIEPREAAGRRILKIVYPGRKKTPKLIEPAVHYATIMEHIKKHAEEAFGHDIEP
ncbi:MAG: DUF4056 domain-containing protein [Sedimentisphaerales bacterium]|nr:DUF4056 domain-containing protein [Sedimentisphaerales bacterium]